MWIILSCTTFVSLYALILGLSIGVFSYIYVIPHAVHSNKLNLNSNVLLKNHHITI